MCRGIRRPPAAALMSSLVRCDGEWWIYVGKRLGEYRVSVSVGSDYFLAYWVSTVAEAWMYMSAYRFRWGRSRCVLDQGFSELHDHALHEPC